MNLAAPGFGEYIFEFVTSSWRTFFFNEFEVSFPIYFDFFFWKSILSNIEIAMPAHFFGSIFLERPFPSFCPKVKSVLDGEVCFLDAKN